MPLRPTKPEFEDHPLTPVRKAIADRVSASMREMPVFHLHREIDAQPLLDARSAAKQALDKDQLPSYNDLLIKAVALAVREFPAMNAWLENDTIRVAKQVNLGFAVATDQGVLLPTVYEADTKPVTQIAEETREMVAMAREGKLRASLQQGATFTISNIGPVGIDAFNAIISPPQVGILAIGSIAMRPFVVDGSVEARQTMKLTLTVDHRAVDGGDAAPFLAQAAANIQGITWPEA